MSMLGKMLGFGRSESYDKGIRLFDQGMYEEALNAFEEARHPRRGRKDEMTERLASFYTAESFAHLGQAAMRRGQWEQSEQYFTGALEIHPHYADLHFNLALAQRANKRMEPSLRSLENALNINPRFAKAHLYRGLICYELDRREDGLKSLSMALDLEPGFRTEAYTKGMNYHHGGEFLAALQAFEMVSHTEVDDILFHFKLGDDLMRRAMYDQAITEYQKALMLNPNYADVRNHLGVAFGAKGLVSEAVAEFRYALAINPRFVDAMLNLAITQRDNGESAEARRLFQEILKLEPENQIAISNLGLLLVEATEEPAPVAKPSRKRKAA